MNSQEQPTSPALADGYPILSAMGVLMGGAALILTIYVAGNQDAEIIKEGDSWLGFSRNVLKPLALTLFIGIVSVILGVVIFSRSSSRKAWGVTAMIFGLLPLLFSLFIVSRSFFREPVPVTYEPDPSDSATAVTAQVASTLSQTGPAPSQETILLRRIETFLDQGNMETSVGKAIPAGPEAYTWKQESEIYRQWYDRHFITAYRNHGHRSPEWDEAMVQFLRDWVKFKVGDSGAPHRRVLFESVRRILVAGCKDPLLLYLASDGQMESLEESRLAQSARTQAADSKYSASVKWIIELRADASQRQKLLPDNRISESDRRSLEYLRESLVQGDYTPDEFVLLHSRLANNPGQAWMARMSEDLCRMLEQTSECPRWYADLIRGQCEVKNAWNVRGRGYANTVTEQGWRGFEAHLAKAKDKLVSSWTLNPKSPYAASEMITVTMGAGDTPITDCRLWFDRAVAARLDYYPAYDKLLWALRPRWHGSHEAMLKFGESCLNTARFDTQVPQYYAKAVRDISEELGDWRIYSHPRVYANLRKTFSGGAAGDTSMFKGRSYLTANLMLAHRVGRYEDAGKDMALLKDDPYLDIIPAWLENGELVPGWIKVWNGPCQKQLLDLDVARNKQEFARALELAGEIRSAVQGDAYLERWSQDVQAVLELEQKLASGDWVPVKLGKELYGWHPYAGTWKGDEDGSIQASAGANGMMLKSLAMIGPDFALRGEVELVSSSTGEFQAGMMFGDLHPSLDKWYGFRIMRLGDEGEAAVVSRTFSNNLRSYSPPFKKSNKFEVAFSGGQVSVSLNETKLINSLVLMQNKNRISPRMAVGLGASSHPNEYVVCYRNLELRRLKSGVLQGKQAAPK